MTRIDLIPKSWRDRFRVRRALRVFGIALGVLFFALLGFRAYLAWQMSQTKAAMARMSEEKASLDEALSKNQTDFKHLEALRAKVVKLRQNQALSVVDSVLKPLDEALVDGVTLGDMTIQFVDLGPDGRAPGGVAPGTAASAHVSLQGESLDAAGLTTVTDRLTATPGWRNLKVGKLAPRREGGNGLEFSLDADVKIARIAGVGR